MALHNKCYRRKSTYCNKLIIIGNTKQQDRKSCGLLFDFNRVGLVTKNCVYQVVSKFKKIMASQR